MSDLDRRVFDAFSAALDKEERSAPRDAQASLLVLKERMKRDTGASRTSSKRVPAGARYLGIAAVVIAFVVGVNYLDLGPQNQTLVQKTYSTTPGQTANINLPGGSRVTLAPATRMQISGNTVDLEGEAIFNVVHNDKSPFIVRTGVSIARVLGTSFSVRSYPRDKSVRVAVESGRVAVGGAGVLTSGDVARITETGEASVVHNVKVSSMLDWQNGMLNFTEARVADVFDELSRWYPVSFNLASRALSDQRITTQVDTRLPVEVVARDMAELLDVGYRRVGKVVEFGGK